MWIQILQGVLSGCATGSIYALIAQGFYVTYITTVTLNFGQGEFLMFGAFLGLTVYVTFGLPAAIAIFLSIVVLSFMGIGLERIAVRSLRAVGFNWVLSTIAVSIALKNVAVLIWGPAELRFPSFFGDRVIRFSGLGILPQEVFILTVSLLTMLLLLIFLRKAPLGKAMLAVAYNSNAAAAVGINVKFIMALAYALSSGMAALGGVLIAPVTFAYANMGGIIVIKSFAAAIFGGLGNPVGILIGGLIIGIAEQLFALVNSDFKDLVSFLFVIVILAIRPTGLLSAQRSGKT
jgi:branched-chain amino acid transport system permease protein